ncbi:Glyoxylate/hydroxypyruvate reductase B [Propionicimonas sp. T2.31MG-18]|uniref:NAD(P)-dependent oxidoreductase n=1 Tax=Propionicimonas sp. T2.31MG-18 TaxID=3157620 RepID=UPI0035E8E879
MRVLVADQFEQSGIDGLTAAGCEVVYAPTLKDQALVEAVAAQAPEVLVVRSTKVPEEVLAAGPLALVVRAGAGYNTIDVAAASRLGIYVSNCPGKNSVAVAELAFGLICALDRRIVDNTVDLRAGTWNKAEYGRARGLHGRTLGLIGLGAIGREMIPRARGFGMPVVAWSRSLTEERAAGLGIRRAASPEEVATLADVVSVHVALDATTRGLLGGSFFAAMKDGATFVNTSRGEIVDERALVEAIRTRGLRAGLDVFANEPSAGTGEFVTEVATLPGVYGTHHIGASTDQAQEAIAAEAVRIVKVFAETGTVPNVVNLAKKTPATSSIVVRHIDRPGILAHTLDVISTAGINVQEMENIVFDGALAAVARINVEGVVEESLLERIRAYDAVIDVHVIGL